MIRMGSARSDRVQETWLNNYQWFVLNYRVCSSTMLFLSNHQREPGLQSKIHFRRNQKICNIVCVWYRSYFYFVNVGHSGLVLHQSDMISIFLREGREQRELLLKKLPKKDLEVGGENPLDGCLHVFVDLGSNRGLQIRKLYESHLFPLAPILPLYEKYSHIY